MELINDWGQMATCEKIRERAKYWLQRSWSHGGWYHYHTIL